MFAPTINGDALGMTRRENAIERSADAIHDMLEWSAPNRQPAGPNFFVVRDRIEPRALNQRVVFTGKFWMSDEPIACWRPLKNGDLKDRPLRPVSSLAGQAAKAGSDLTPAGMPRSTLMPAGGAAKTPAAAFGELSLVPIDDEPELELHSIRQCSALELKVEVVKFVRPAPEATGTSTGKVLAVSENYSAQHLGGDRVVIHENSALDRPLKPGEKVTMAYESGRAKVYDGLTHDVNIEAPWMPNEQRAYLRMVMLDALSMMRDPRPEDERLQDAMRMALESTASFFGPSETRLRRADIKLVVNERRASYTPPEAEAPNAAAARPRSPRP